MAGEVATARRHSDRAVRVTAKVPRVRAPSIRQPFAEMILRGMKTVEYRSRPTQSHQHARQRY